MCTHLFNIGGYHLLFKYLQQTNHQHVLHAIEKGEYADEDLVLVKVPLLLPYSTNWEEYERYDGEIEWGGVHYNYVKRKISNDSLYLLCLPDIKRTRLSEAKSSYAMQVQNTATSGQNEKNTEIQKPVLSKDYDQQRGLNEIQKVSVVSIKAFHGPSAALICTVIDLPLQPPDHTIS